MKQILIALCLISGITRVCAQQKKDGIDTEVINVISSYIPAISDAFKTTDQPLIKPHKSKKNLHYKINAHFIESTFIPTIGTFKSITVPKEEERFQNLLKVGYGNYNTPFLESFLQKQIKEHAFSFFLYNKASNNEKTNNLKLDNNYLNTKIDLRYRNTQKDYSWETAIGYHRDLYNWYGLPFISKDNISKYNTLINSIEEEQIYNTFTLEGVLNSKKGPFKRTRAVINTFSDQFDSKETEINLHSQFEFSMLDKKIKTDLNLDILSGEFKKSFRTEDKIKYQFLNFGTKAFYPSIQEDGFSINIATKILFNTDMYNNNSKLYLYPDILLNYELIKDKQSVYGGLNGDLKQHSYREFANLNPYISPTLEIKPTNNLLNIFAGLKGSLTSSIYYDLKATYHIEKDKALFKQNENLAQSLTPVNHGYEAGNSFYTLYDTVKTLALYAAVHKELSENLSTGASITINSYHLNFETEAWNLPSFTSKLFANYTYKKWASNAQLFLVGQRKDADFNSKQIIDLKAYADLNLDVAYKFNPKWSGFLEINNLFGKHYQRFSNFEVQGTQVLLGFNYTFNL